MPTNDERREVAARLRKCIRFAKECDQNNEGEMISENGNVMFRDIAEAVGGDYANFIDSYEETLTKLADLIEPEPERTVNLTEAVDAICGQMCGDGWDWSMRAETAVRTVAEMCGAKVIGD